MDERKATRIDREREQALAHPLRVRILAELQGRAASPTELSGEMGQSAAAISYHAQPLLDCDCLELLAPLRAGAGEHLLRATAPSEAVDAGFEAGG